MLNPTFDCDLARGNQRRTTDAFQLATAVLFQSPLQHFGLVPQNLKTRQVTIGADGQITLSLEPGGGAVLFE